MENTGKPGKCILVCAGHFDENSLPLEAGDFLIAADNGLAYLKKLGAEPDLILGDFDSLEEEDRPLLGIQCGYTCGVFLCEGSV